ncbi:hypothetical protein HU675_0038670 [Bradyrhizobium septentrionale]|uniref:hypothetical protein n=1 Tax=Bradyrhizobium septentrionale TaxID=1404411 RepID=UPI001596CF0F|nr:hypothetical protein [Bradyrhizobium septentrionale]UGY23811.1 hypothetical protein HU675_0038670 [Bradyrhizobium septentrionale]
MPSKSATIEPMTPKDRARYGAAVAKDAAFDAVHELWRRRHAEGLTQREAANSIGADEGWFSKQFNGPRNWTMESFGALVQSLNGSVEIVVRAIEDVVKTNLTNYDAYDEMDDLPPHNPKQWNPKELKPSTETKGTVKANPHFEGA